jgi:hypothetical protein
MDNQPIPILAYTFIGITSLVLAYATFLDKGSSTGSPEPSSGTSLLPSVFSKPLDSITNIVPTAAPVTENIPINENPKDQPVFGGKTKRNKKKHTNTKRKNKSKSNHKQ